jgi:hypothetical protein
MLGDHQYELDGVTFGLDMPVAVFEDGFTPGSATLESQRTQMPSGDGVRFGRDSFGGMTWSFKLYTDCDTEAEAYAALSELHGVWPREKVRKTSGAVVPLRYRVGGRTRRVYGRPGRFTATPNNLSLSGRIDAVADFETVDHLVYDDMLNQHTIGLALPPDPDAGLLVPFIAPFQSQPGSVPRQTSITIGGTEPTPIWMVFRGEITNPAVKIGGKNVQIQATTTTSDPVTVDARPWARSVTKASGGGVRINPRVTKLSELYLPPGEHEVVFSGLDASGTGSVQVCWHNAFKSP